MNDSASTIVDASNAPLALLDLEVPGSTGPTPTGEQGINRAAAQDNFPQNGLQIFIQPWGAMGEGDSVQVFLGDDAVVSDLIDALEVNERLTLFIDSARLTNDLSSTLSYKVTRLGQRPEDSAKLPVYIKLTLPGGNDQNGDTPGHSELHLEIDQEYIENGVDKDQAAEGVPVLIKAYPNMAEHDDIRLSWGGQFIEHSVLKAEVNTDIQITVDEATILAAGDSGSEGLAVTFEVYDLVDNRSEDWSAEIRLEVDTGSTRLNAPIIKEAANNVIDLDVLGDNPATAQIVALPPNFAVNDQIEVTLRGTAADGTPVNFTCSPKPITSVPSVPEVLVPNAHVRLLAQTQAIFTYRLLKADTSVLTGKGRFVNIIGEVKRLLAPIAIDASQGSLDPTLVRTTIQIPWDDAMDEGQVIDLKWLGVRPDQSIYFPELNLHTITHNEAGAKAPIPMTVVGTHLASIDGGTLELYYELISDVTVRALVRRESVHAAVLNVGVPRAELPAPVVEGEVDGVLDPEEVPAGTRLIVRKYNGITAGDEVHCEWVGSITGKYEDYVRLNSITATRDVSFDIQYKLIADNLGGTVDASYFVNRASNKVSASDVLPLAIGEQTVPLPDLDLTIDAVIDGELNLDDVVAGVKAQVAPYDLMEAGDDVYLYWVDDKGSTPYEDVKTITNNSKGKPVLFTVPFANASASLDANVTVTARAVLFEGGELNSVPDEFLVTDGDEQYPSLSLPTIVEALDGVLDPTDVPQGATVVVGSEVQLKTGDSVTLTWQGQPGDGSVRPTVPVVIDGELNIPITYATVIANDGHSVKLSYTVRRLSGVEQGPSPEATYEVRTELASGLLKVMGARYNRSSYRASACSRHLSAFNSTTMQPIEAQWQYQGDASWTTATTWRDTDCWKLLNVKTSNDSMTLNPSNIIGNGTDAATVGQAAFVAHRDVGDVVGWGLAAYGAAIPSTIITMDDIEEVSCTRSAFAARRKNGHVVVWGTATDGGSMGSVSPLGFRSVTSNNSAFAGVKTTGQVVAWGVATSGAPVPAPIDAYIDIERVIGAGTAFAAMRQTGEVVAWGAPTLGGTVPGDIAGMTDIVEVRGSFGAFAAWRGNRRLVAWGNAGYGGAVPDTIAAMTDIIELSAANARAFSARRSTGQVVAWGDPGHGGTVPDLIIGLTDIVSVVSTWQSFAALRGNGHVVAWGGSVATGGVVPDDIAALSDIVQVASTSTAFAALRKNGSVVAWGNAELGGNISSVVTLLTNVLALYGNTNGFVALTSDGRVVTWGNAAAGGDSSAVQDRLAGQVSYKASAASRSRGLAVKHSRSTRLASTSKQV